MIKPHDETLGMDDALARVEDCIDVRIHGAGGNIYMVQPVSDAAREWVDENVSVEPWAYMGDRFACDHHYIENLIAGMRGDGLEVE